MSESTPIFDPPTLPDGPAAVQSEALGPVASIHNGENGINGQDVTMGGQEDSGNKAVKPGDNSSVSPPIALAPLLPSLPYCCLLSATHCALPMPFAIIFWSPSSRITKLAWSSSCTASSCVL